MADEQAQQRTERDVREREDAARERRTGAESERAAEEREAEEPGGRSGDVDRVIPDEADEARGGDTRME